MEYTIKKMAYLSGVSARTLRYYDEIELLKPKRINSSGYRIYGQDEVDKLQQILFYRKLDLKLEEIKTILDQPDFDVEKALYDQQKKLVLKKMEIDKLLETVQKTILYYKGDVEMSDKQKFEGLKNDKLQENEKEYGKEIREKYGDNTITNFNKNYLNMTENEYNKMQELESQLFAKLFEYQQNPNLKSDIAQDIFQLHKNWLMCSWENYSTEAHRAIGLMYVEDERFSNYYDKEGEGFAENLNNIIQKYTL